MDTLRQRPPRRHLRVFSSVFVGFVLLSFGLMSWFTIDQAGWDDADATILTRDVQSKRVYLSVEFYPPGGPMLETRVTEYEAAHAVGQTVRIRYDLAGPSEVRNARLMEEPIVPVGFLVTGGVMLVIGLGALYWAWWRMPRDSRRSPKRSDQLA